MKIDFRIAEKKQRSMDKQFAKDTVSTRLDDFTKRITSLVSAAKRLEERLNDKEA